MRTHPGPVSAQAIPLHTGCRPRRRRSSLWNHLLELSCEGVVGRWSAFGPDLPWAPDLQDVAFLLWADNVFMLAVSGSASSALVRDAATASRDFGLQFSSASWGVLASTTAGDGEWGTRAMGHRLARVQVLPVLGVGLDA